MGTHLRGAESWPPMHELGGTSFFLIVLYVWGHISSCILGWHIPGRIYPQGFSWSQICTVFWARTTLHRLLQICDNWRLFPTTLGHILFSASLYGHIGLHSLAVFTLFDYAWRICLPFSQIYFLVQIPSSHVWGEDTRGFLSAEIASIPWVCALCVFIHTASLQGEFRCLKWCLAAISVARLSCFLALCSIYSTRHKGFSGIVSRGNGESPVD